MSDAGPMAPLDDPSLPFTALDRALVRTLQRLQPASEPRAAWLAALASHQLGRGHACLEVGELATDPRGLLGWSDEAIGLLPAGLADAVGTLDWASGDDSPLVLVPPPSPASVTATVGGTRGARLYLRRAWSAEQRVLASLFARCAAAAPAPTDLEAELDELFPAPASGTAVDWQRRACEVAARHRVSIVTGGPGTGKTTTVARLLAVLLRDARRRGVPLRISLAAPTGKAAARLSQSILARRAELPADVAAELPTVASTLHKLLGFRAGAARGAAADPLAADVVVIDEASMVDLEMMAALLDAVPLSARLVLLGDKDQLASVEAGAVLAQLCANPALSAQVVTLRQSHRFRADSGIGRWARLVNEGDVAGIAAALDDCPPWRRIDGPATGARVVESLAVQRLAARAPGTVSWGECLRDGWQEWLSGLEALTASGRDCTDAEAGALLDAFGAFQALCALRQGPWGVEALNPLIERSLGFPREDWYPGRPVMVTRNDYALRLMNGDVGLCLPCADGLRVAFRDTEGAVRWVAPARLEGVETVFATTVHKSQGSEYRHVLLVLPDRPSPVVTRELLYTGITRAMRRLTLLVPTRDVLLQAVRERVRRSGGLADPPRERCVTDYEKSGPRF
jgi:exodeoxyribonuclease V alpha subunit